MSASTNASASALTAKDANVPMPATETSDTAGPIKNMEYHRQILKSKMEAQEYAHASHPQQQDFRGSDVVSHLSRSGNNYISPSDEIMSPCTAKLSAMRNKQVGKYVLVASLSPLARLSQALPSFLHMLGTDHLLHRMKPKSLFAQASSKKLQSSSDLGSLFGGKASPPASASPTKE